MALPKLNTLPSYEMTIPSSGKKVHYRPFLVKEEKAIMIASESGKNSDVFRALVRTISDCIEEPITEQALTSFDIEYAFLQMRARSVGETASIALKCEKCEASNPIQIKLDEVKIVIPDIEKTIKLTDEISVELDWPSFEEVVRVGSDNAGDAENAFKLIASCLRAVVTEEERINLRDSTDEELKEFIESMNSNQFAAIRDFIDKIPALNHNVDFTCSSCNHENKLVIEGLQNFL